MTLFEDEKVDYSSCTFPDLRQFQKDSHDELRKGGKEGHRCQMIMAATGAGKTILSMNIIQQSLIKGKRVLFVADQINLIDQTSKVADSLGLHRHGIIQAGNPRTDLSLPFQIASVQTLMRRGIPKNFDVVVIDEAHLQYKVMTKYIQETDAYCLGLSATPFSTGLGKIYTRLINCTTMNELTNTGILVPMRVFSCHKIDMSGAETAAGEWTDKAAGERALQIKGDVVLDWAKFTPNEKTIGFFPDIATAEQYTTSFNLAGYSAKCYTSKTDDNERNEILAEYKKPHSSIRLLLSVQALAKGFDVPDITVGIDARPFRKSLSSVIQMWGRILRSHPGKNEAKLLDFSGNIVRFLDDYTEIFYNGLSELDQGDKLDKKIRHDKEEKEPSKCPACGVSPCGKKCLSCGFERKSKPSTVEVESGEMKEIVIKGKKLADDARDLYEQLCSYHRQQPNPEKAAGRVWYQFQEITGQKPPSSWKYEIAPDVRVTKATIGKLKSLRVAFMNSKKRNG